MKAAVRPTKPAPKGVSSSTAAIPMTKLIDTITAPPARELNEAQAQNKTTNRANRNTSTPSRDTADKLAAVAHTKATTKTRVRTGVAVTVCHSGRGSPTDGEIGTGRLSPN